MGIACIIISYLLIKAMKNAIIYFFPYEEYEIINDRLDYKKKLKLFGKSFVMEKSVGGSLELRRQRLQ